MSLKQSLFEVNLHRDISARALSVQALKQNYATINTPSPFGSYHDTRVYVDPVTNVEYWPFMYSKGLDHDSVTGFAKKVDILKLIKAIQDGDFTKIEIYSDSTRRKIEGPLTHLSSPLMGPNVATISFDPQRKIEDPKTTFEMFEVFGRSKVRTVPFTSYDSDPTIGNLVSALNTIPANITSATVDNAITRQTVLRGTFVGETTGPFISQFLLHPFLYGNLEIEQKYRVETLNGDARTSSNWSQVQDGFVALTGSVDPETKYTYNGQVLSSKVHNDPLYQFYYNAALIALQNGIKPQFSHSANVHSSSWTEGGAPDIFATIAAVSLGALKLAWYQKFSQNMHIRPEVSAQRYNEYYTGLNDPMPHQMFLSQIFANSQIENYLNTDIFNDMKTNMYLEGLYPEGSPMHPSNPAGHATVAGACVTILKAMLTTHEMQNGVWVPLYWHDTGSNTPRKTYVSNDGNTLTDIGNQQVTIAGELNKLAANVAYGRDFAGVHFRHDGLSGMKSAELYAIEFLKDKVREYYISNQNSAFNGFVLEKFDGEIIIIS